MICSFISMGKRLKAFKSPKRICKNIYLVDDITETVFINCGKDEDDMHYTVYVGFDEFGLDKRIFIK